MVDCRALDRTGGTRARSRPGRRRGGLAALAASAAAFTGPGGKERPMTRMRDGMARLLTGQAPPPPVATLLGMRLASFTDGEAGITLAAGGQHTDSLGTGAGGGGGLLAVG